MSHPPPAATTPISRTPAAAVALTLLALLLGAGPPLLAYLSRFGPTPVERLPLLAVALFGLLFVGSLFDLCSRFERRQVARRLTAFALLSALATLGAALSGWGEWRYLLAPLTAALVGAILLLGLRRPARAGLYAAGLVYVGATLLANFTLDSFLPLGGFFLINVGTLFFGLTFTQRDRIHRYGRRAVYGMILLAATSNVLLAAALGTPLRYVAVSFVTILLAETADTEVYQRLLGRRWLVRVASSNAVSAPLDTLLFTLLAFWGESFATPAWMTQVIVTDVLVKYAAGMAAALGMVALLRSVWPQARLGYAGPVGGIEPPRRERMASTTFAALPGLVGRSFGPSPYIAIDQARIDAFAAATLDPQWIHVDPARAATGPFGTTVAHGYLTLSLLVKMVQDLGILPAEASLVVNYGLNKARFPAPVPSGARVRCRAEVKGCDAKGEGRLLITLGCTVEIEGSETPALVAEILYLVIA